MALILRNAQLITEQGVLSPGYLIAGNDGYIWDLGRDVDDNVLAPSDTSIDQGELGLIESKEIDLQGKYLAPGFIDLHTHGGLGFDIMDADTKGLEKISAFYLKQGVTGFLATTFSSSWSEIKQAVGTVRKYLDNKASNQIDTNLLGMHLEGPFINPEKKGVQTEKNIIPPSLKSVNELWELAGAHLYMISLAPEMKNASQLIKWGRRHNIIMSAAHTDATYEEMNNAFSAGLSHGAHLFNGMSAIHHRAPGAAIALLLHPEATIELIVDGKHLHPAILDLVIKQKPLDKIVLVTDSIRGTGLEEGKFQLDKQIVTVKNNTAKTQEGQLAGSTLTIPEALKNIMKFTSLSLTEAVKMISLTPAKILGLSQERGSLLPGKRADAAVLTEKLEVKNTILKGKLINNEINS
ncbi:N-acetylglucosamine-6-phosphate deacetylase [Natranaerobius thermophilus]|uniref:N-acetylglucosamine-6-phosphate deacetylase n=1 Tax=Natranaerobius thermophilus (strain ATCC BAA-1301 / DSM 18059 / JW/NM-WN-LF) TaxID=457570 RepID=B2A2V1_NATTJ|nr:N-acetylglucosamine-6-phosphate deacetylase [Natranaerobius thermophilus]ACB86319.1 N-acetylglucosamine-6-phosphate deacetylase [Natranaerobius thermophilus JW/NM-WN-LF]